MFSAKYLRCYKNLDVIYSVIVKAQASILIKIVEKQRLLSG